MQETKGRIIEQNPHLAEFISNYAGRSPQPLHLPIIENVMAVLTLIELQAEADLMGDIFPDLT